MSSAMHDGNQGSVMTDDLMNPVGTDGEEISEKHFSRLCLAQYDAETIAYFSNQLAPPELDWVSLRESVERGVLSLGFDATHALSIRQYLLAKLKKSEGDLEALEFFREKVEWFVNDNWSDFEKALADKALSCFCKTNSEFFGFASLLDEWPLLVNSPALLDQAVACYVDDYSSGVWQLKGLAMLCGNPVYLRPLLIRALTLTDRNPSSADNVQAFSNLAYKWTPKCPWVQLLLLLWGDREHVSVALPADVTLAWEKLSFVRFDPHGPRPKLRLNSLCAESEAAWRRQLRDAVGNNRSLRMAVTELLLWFGHVDHDRAIIFAVLEVWGNQVGEALSEMASHPDSLVRLRAEAVRGLIEQAPDAAQLLQQAQSIRLNLSTSSNCGAPPRTWLADATIERLIEAEFEAGAANYSHWVPKTGGSGEETHVAMLFEKLAAIFKNINDQVSLLASQRKQNEHLEFELSYRIVGKFEEGNPHLAAKKFSTDICLVFEAHDVGNQPFTSRASLIQAKRLHGGHVVGKSGSYPIDFSQLQNLILQTPSSYLLLLGPCAVAPMPVIPVRLYLDLIARGASPTGISPDFASNIGKSLASWLLYDVIGLWAGDPNPKLLDKAKGCAGSEPYILAKLTARNVKVII